MKAHYFSPALLYYRAIKVLTETGAVRLTDTWKFKHHTIKVPTVTTADRIVQATRQLTAAIQGTNNPPPDELEAIEQLRALLTSDSATPPQPQQSVPSTIEESTEQPTVASAAMPAPAFTSELVGSLPAAPRLERCNSRR